MRRGQKAPRKLCVKCAADVPVSVFERHVRACMAEVKTCIGPCGQTLQISEFYKIRQDSPWRQGRCKGCLRLQVDEWEKLHPEHKKVDRDYARRMRIKNPEKFRLKDLKSDLKKRGLSLEGFEALLVMQNYVCALCGQPNKSKGRQRLAVDHSHVTGQTRGLLCDLCNHALERLETVSGWAVLAQQYLDKYTSTEIFR